jgi:basic membrane lipoprotein Med (substrate-binding protein (PBP1-ABC) superfamily)
MRPIRFIALFAGLAVLVAACGEDGTTGTPATPGATQSPAKTLRVAFVYDGQIDDGGWNQQHDLARRFLEQNLPGVQTTVVEGIAPGQQAQNTFDDLASQGHQLIVGTTYYQDDVLAVNEDYPDTVFISWAGFKTADNVGAFDAATEDGRYLDGLVAGSVTKSNIIGYPAGFPIEEVVPHHRVRRRRLGPVAERVAGLVRVQLGSLLPGAGEGRARRELEAQSLLRGSAARHDRPCSIRAGRPG